MAVAIQRLHPVRRVYVIPVRETPDPHVRARGVRLDQHQVTRRFRDRRFGEDRRVGTERVPQDGAIVGIADRKDRIAELVVAARLVRLVVVRIGGALEHAHILDVGLRLVLPGDHLAGPVALVPARVHGDPSRSSR